MRLFIWFWDVIKGIFIKKKEAITTLVELKPAVDRMESLEDFIDVTLTV
jgi:hypothetical protein